MANKSSGHFPLPVLEPLVIGVNSAPQWPLFIEENRVNAIYVPRIPTKDNNILAKAGLKKSKKKSR